MKKWAWWAILGITILKLPFLWTNHIQEDAFITWRVAQNLLDHGVIGYNGDIKISSSTTHLYVFITVLFKMLLGKHFMYPLIIFNTFLFSFGSYLFSQLFFEEKNCKALLFTVLLNLIPSALVASYLGMEYAIIFVNYAALLYLGIYKHKQWALFVFSILLLWTRLDTAIFLGMTWLAYTLYHRKWNWYFTLGGIVGFVTVMGFNYFYFGDFINHTIKAKSIAYQQEPPAKWYMMKAFLNISLVKYFSFWIILPGAVFILASLFSFWKLIKDQFSKDTKVVMLAIMSFALAKWVIFSFALANFDWYYWVPKTVFFMFILAYVLNFHYTRIKVIGFVLLIVLPMTLYQTIHSTATGNGEWNYRREIGLYLDKLEPDKSQYIMLEPAGYIPYFSGLKVMDEVGLVDERITQEMEADYENWWYNSVTKYKPKYLLTLFKVGTRSYYSLTDEQQANFDGMYEFSKAFEIKDALKSENPILEKIYHLKPSGRNYYLYVLKDENQNP